MITKETLIEFGLTKDENNLQLKEVFKNRRILKEIHIDTYSDNPFSTSSTSFMLLLRTIEKKIIVSNDGDRLILKKVVDKFETHFMNILFLKITECCYRKFNNYYEFILNIQNIYYKITVYN